MKFILTILLSLLSVATFAQPEMADALYENGKIYVVVAVVAVIFAGIIVYLISIDRKVSKIEKQLNNK